MADQEKTSESSIAAAPAVAPAQDPMIRLHCLDLASRMGLPYGDQVVKVANAFVNFVSGAPAEPPMKPISDLPPYQQRVIDEKNELDEKLSALRQFLESDKFAQVDPEEQRRMQDQAKYMQQYSDVLWLRIDNFASLPKGGA